MNSGTCSLLACLLLCLASAFAESSPDLPGVRSKRDVPYPDDGHERHGLDIYAPENARGLPVMLWIHGGGWRVGGKSDVALKPKLFTETPRARFEGISWA